MTVSNVFLAKYSTVFFPLYQTESQSELKCLKNIIFLIF
jgi:hypothetical protein